MPTKTPSNPFAKGSRVAYWPDSYHRPDDPPPWTRVREVYVVGETSRTFTIAYPDPTTRVRLERKFWRNSGRPCERGEKTSGLVTPMDRKALRVVRETRAYDTRDMVVGILHRMRGPELVKQEKALRTFARSLAPHVERARGLNIEVDLRKLTKAGA